MNENKIQKISEEALTELIETAKRIRGSVIGVSSRGFGFIETKEIPFTRIYFHWSALRNIHFSELKYKDRVEFEVIEVADKGLRAISIMKIEDDVQAKA